MSPPPSARSPPPRMITSPRAPRAKRRRKELKKPTSPVSPPKHPCPPTCINPAHHPYRPLTTPLQPLRASLLPLPRPPTSFPIIRSRIVNNKVNKPPLAPPGFFIARGVLSPSSSSSSMVVVTKNNEYKCKMKHRRRRGVSPVPVAPQTMSAVVKAMSSSDGVAILVSSASEDVKEERPEDGSKYVSRVADYHKCSEDLVEQMWNRTRGDVVCSNPVRPFLIPVEELKRNRQRVSVVDYLIEGDKGVVSENSGSCRVAIEIRKMPTSKKIKVEDMPAKQILEAVLGAIGMSNPVEFEEENVDAAHLRWFEMTADYMIAHRSLSRLKKDAEERLQKAGCTKAS